MLEYVLIALQNLLAQVVLLRSCSKLEEPGASASRTHECLGLREPSPLVKGPLSFPAEEKNEATPKTDEHETPNESEGQRLRSHRVDGRERRRSLAC